MIKRLLILALVCLLISARATAQNAAVPPLLSFQGRLARPDGTPVRDGNYALRFSLWNVATGGVQATNEKWNQTFNTVAVRNGTFAVLLNANTTGLFSNNLWLEIKVGNDVPLAPRQPLVSVAYAFKADSVKDGAITGASIANGTITADKLASGVVGGSTWSLSGNSGVTSGFLGTTDSNPLVFKVANRRAMRYSLAEYTVPGNAFRSVNVLGGSEINEIMDGVVGATIAGGGRDSLTDVSNPNAVRGDFATVGGGAGNAATTPYATVAGGFNNGAWGTYSVVPGGEENIASGSYSVIGGGRLNNASALFSIIAGGVSNTALSYGSTIGGGAENRASGQYAAIPGGAKNEAGASYTLAAGFHAKARHDGAFVWGDSQDSDFASTAANQFLIRAAGGVGIGTNAPDQALTLNSAGATSMNVKGANGAQEVVMGADSSSCYLYAKTNYALFLSASANPRSKYMTIHSNGNVGIDLISASYKLDVNGSLRCYGFTNSSDARLKENITPLKNALDSILGLQGVTFDWKQAAFPDKNFPKGRQVGFIAQEVEKVLPELVSTDGEGYKSVAYANVVPVLVEALKTQETRLKAVEANNAALAAKNAQMEARLSTLEALLLKHP